MIILIKSDQLTATINTKGAELSTIVNNETHLNYLWSGDAKFWAKHSPILFPIVGALKDNEYWYQNKKYNLPRHGFARDMEFDYHQVDETEAVFILKSTSATLVNYPFEFELSVRYKVSQNSLSCVYQVQNPDDKSLLFSLGAHPAFAAPLGNNGSYLDYYLAFNEDQVLTSHLIKDNLISEATETIALQQGVLPLTHDLFYQDALVFKDLKSTTIKLLNTKNANGLEFKFRNFPFFGIWAAIDADFVCLEPWCGVADSETHNKKLEDKEGIVKLEAFESWQREWEVSFF